MGWLVDHINFVTAVFNGTINGYDIFVECLFAYEIGINLVYKLLQAFYRLK